MIAWRKSSFSDTANSCVEVRHESDVVYVRDSKLGDDSPVQEWPDGDWLFLTDAIASKQPRFSGYLKRADGSVRLGLARLDHPVLLFNADEWKAFEYGCRAGEFDPDRLTEKFQSSSSRRGVAEEVREGSGGVAGPDQAATGAGVSASPPAPVAAPLNVPAGRAGEDTPPVSPGLPAVNGQPGPEINFALLAELATKPHPLLNIADDFERQIRSIPIAWTGEVFQEARTAHHLLDMAGIPRGKGYSSDLDARTWLAIAELGTLRDRLARIADWHSRKTGPGGTFDDYCCECGEVWPCDTNRMANGTYVDEDAEDAKANAPLPVAAPACGPDCDPATCVHMYDEFFPGVVPDTAAAPLVPAVETQETVS